MSTEEEGEEEEEHKHAHTSRTLPSPARSTFRVQGRFQLPCKYASLTLQSHQVGDALGALGLVTLVCEPHVMALTIRPPLARQVDRCTLPRCVN